MLTGDCQSEASKNADGRRGATLARNCASIAAQRGVGIMPELLMSSLIVLAMGFGLILCVWGVFTVLPVVNRVVTRWFGCGLRNRNGSELQEDPWDRRAVDVKRWASDPSSAMTCDNDYLRLPKLDPARDPEANEANAERVAEEMLIEPRWVTADAKRVAMEELLIELRR